MCFPLFPIQTLHENQFKIFLHVFCLKCLTNQKRDHIPEVFGAVRGLNEAASYGLNEAETA